MNESAHMLKCFFHYLDVIVVKMNNYSHAISIFYFEIIKNHHLILKTEQKKRLISILAKARDVQM